MQPLSTFIVSTVMSVLCINASLAYGAPSPASAAPQERPAVVPEDPDKWRRDPFISSVKKGGGSPATKGGLPKPVAGMVKMVKAPEPEQDIQLQGIMQADRAFHALINGRSVKAGDTIGAVTVKEISRFKVVILNERKEKIIYDIYQGRIDRGKQ